MIIKGSTFALSALCLSWTPSALYNWLTCPEYQIQRALGLSSKGTASELPVTTGQVKRVAIIGGGTAGLAALKTFVRDIPKPDGQHWEIELFEQRHDLGGVWSVLCFCPSGLILTSTVTNPGWKRTVRPVIHVFHKRHYTHKCARTVLSRQVSDHFISRSPSRNTDHHFDLITVTYPRFPYPPRTPLYPSYERVQAYHRGFASHFKLLPHVHFNHSLEAAYWVGNASNGFWELLISINGSQVEIVPSKKVLEPEILYRSQITRHFDHLVVASGHVHYPRLPEWATDDAAHEWLRNGKSRNIVHSIYFREPEEYAGKTILVVGAGGSGEDVVIRLSGCPKKVRPS